MTLQELDKEIEEILGRISNYGVSSMQVEYLQALVTLRISVVQVPFS